MHSLTESSHGHADFLTPFVLTISATFYAHALWICSALRIPQCSIQNRSVYISVLNGALWHMEEVHHGICEIGLLPVKQHWKIWVLKYVRKNYITKIKGSTIKTCAYFMGYIRVGYFHMPIMIMTSSNGNIFRVTGSCAGNSPVTGEFPSQR